MVIFLQEDHELPLIDATARIRGGSVDGQRTKPGWSISMERSGARAVRSPKPATSLTIISKCVPRKSKLVAGRFDHISLSCLKGDLDDVFKAYVDVLQNPEFRADKIDIARKAMQDAISRRNDEIGDIAHRESIKLAYGPDNPYAEYSNMPRWTRSRART